jgi:hydrogenase maturation protease
MSDRIPLLVLGLGNVLLGDDGAGVTAVDYIARHYDVPDGVSLHDGGTLGLSLLPLVTSAERVILVDAVAADAPAGSLVQLVGEQVAHASLHRLSPHQVGVADLLDGARLVDRLPETLLLIGVVPESIELEVGLSPPVAASIVDLAHLVVAQAARLGFVFVPGETHAPELARERSAFHVARLAGM